MSIIVGINISETDVATSSGQYTLGTLANVDSLKIYRFIRANGALAVGDVVGIDESFDATPVTTTTSAPGTGQGLQCGVVVTALADNEFGWVQVYGFTDAVNVATNAAAHTNLNTTATGGRLDDDATVGAELIEGITTTAAESSNSAAGVINWPYIGATIAA